MATRTLFLIVCILVCVTSQPSVYNVALFADFSSPQTQAFVGTNFFNFMVGLSNISDMFKVMVIPLQLTGATETCNITCFINALVYEVLYNPPSNLNSSGQLFWLQCFVNWLYSLNTNYQVNSIKFIAINCAPIGVNMNTTINAAVSFVFPTYVGNETAKNLMTNFSNTAISTQPYMSNPYYNESGTITFPQFGANYGYFLNVAGQACTVLETQEVDLPTQCQYFNTTQSQ